jgi:MFS family permease
MVGGQLTLGVLSLSFAFAQLATGPFVDHFGRRPVLTFGLSVYRWRASVRACNDDDVARRHARNQESVSRPRSCPPGQSCATCTIPEPGARVLARALTGLGMIAVRLCARRCIVATADDAVALWHGHRTIGLAHRASQEQPLMPVSAQRGFLYPRFILPRTTWRAMRLPFLSASRGALTLLATAALVQAAAIAQIAPPRTLDELKEEVQIRAERKAYPVAAPIRQSARRLATKTLDRDEWRRLSALGIAIGAGVSGLRPGTAGEPRQSRIFCSLLPLENCPAK